MSFPFNIFSNPFYSREDYIWVPVKIIHETKKAILIDNGQKTWIPKFQIKNMRIKNGKTEIYVKESVVG